MSRSPLTSYQRFVVLAAWLGLGFDLMDAVLFTFVAPIAVPSLLGFAPTAPEARSAVPLWTGIVTSVMLLGWTLGGIVFGRLSDRIGRTRTVILTMLIYSLGTAACALAPNIWTLSAMRFVAALGLGGEWAAGVTLVAESVPDDRRVGMGTLLSTSATAGTFLAVAVNFALTGGIPALATRPDHAWRLVMAFGALPAIFALLLRRRLKEPEQWVRAESVSRGEIRDLFLPRLRARTLGGVTLALIALVTFWTTTTFLPIVASSLAEHVAPRADAAAAAMRRASYITRFMAVSNLGALLGMLAAASLADRIGRRPLFLVAFAVSTVSLVVAFGISWSDGARLLLIGVVALPIGAAIGAFHFYLPELFPVQLRSTGAAFCMNAARLATVAGPLLVGFIASRVPVFVVMTALGVVPLVGFLLVVAGVGVETRGQKLESTDGTADR